MESGIQQYRKEAMKRLLFSSATNREGNTVSGAGDYDLKHGINKVGLSPCPQPNYRRLLILFLAVSCLVFIMLERRLKRRDSFCIFSCNARYCMLKD